MIGKPAVVPAVAVVQTEKDFVPILKSVAERKDDGSFVFSYEGADGSYREEVGIVKNAGTDDETLEVSGSYRYLDADGQLIEVRYTAGENGFVPQGTNIPQEISLAAKAAAEFARSHPVEVEVKWDELKLDNKINHDQWLKNFKVLYKYACLLLIN